MGRVPPSSSRQRTPPLVPDRGGFPSPSHGSSTGSRSLGVVPHPVRDGVTPILLLMGGGTGVPSSSLRWGDIPSSSPGGTPPRTGLGTPHQNLDRGTQWDLDGGNTPLGTGWGYLPIRDWMALGQVTPQAVNLLQFPARGFSCQFQSSSYLKEIIWLTITCFSNLFHNECQRCQFCKFR